MRIPRNLAFLLLAVFLILWGLIALLPSLGVLNPILALIALAAGVLLLLQR